MKQLMLLWILLLAVIFRTHAQTGAISGTVTDGEKRPVTGASITISQNGTVSRSTSTDANGVYKVLSLVPGNYSVKAASAGFKTEIKEVVVKIAKTTTVNFELRQDVRALKEVAIIKHTPAVTENIQLAPPYPTKDVDTKANRRSEAGRVKLDVAKSRYMPTVGYGTEINALVMQEDQSMYSRKSKKLPQAHPADESYKKEAENDFRDVHANPLSTMSIDVDRASYSNVRRFINDGQMPPADAVRIEEMVNYFNYDYSQPEGNEPLNIVTTLTDCPWQPKHKLLHIGMQARTVPTEDLPASNLVFLVDVSGSMSSENKLPLAKTALTMLTGKLRAKDKISIVVYAGSAGLVLPATSGANKKAIYAALDRLSAGGSTAGGAGIKLAYKIAEENFVHNGNNRVILATDGDFNVGVSGDNEMETLITQERKKGVYLTCLGFGMGNYKDSKMEILADKGNGNYAYIDNEQEAEKTMVKEFGGTIFTLAKDVKTQIEFNPDFVQSYRLVGYENRMLNNEDFKDDKKDAGDMGSGHSVTIMYEIIPTGAKSKSVRNVDPLKYQSNTTTGSDELATIKFRYKKPNGNTSKEMVHVITPEAVAIQRANRDVRFATSVAMFGMLLKNSQYKGASSYNKVLAMANTGIGRDKEGYRAEFIQMVNKVKRNNNSDEGNTAIAGWYDEE